MCEETANYLVIWCIDLEVEEVCADSAEWGWEGPKALPFFLIFLKFSSSFMFVQKITVGMKGKRMHFKHCLESNIGSHTIIS